MSDIKSKEELGSNIHDAIWDSIYAEGGEVHGGNKASNKCFELAIAYASSQCGATWVRVEDPTKLEEKVTIDNQDELWEEISKLEWGGTIIQKLKQKYHITKNK